MPESRGYTVPANAVPASAAERGIETGTLIASKYRVDRVIGKGGMGVVVAATQLALDRMVAIKLVRSDCAGEPMAVERLLREAKAAASIKSEHVARVLDVGTLDDGAPFIVMEYLEGLDLQSLLERDGPLPVADAVDIVLEACEALAEAHRNGIVHRDIKPANLFLARLPGGTTSVKVVDFGISKLMRPDPSPPLTLPATVVGSLYHMAPEQMRGAPVDARTDVWALGLLLFELLTGKKPFQEQAWPAVCAHVLHGSGPLIEGPVPGVSDELLVLIGKCVRRQPFDRYGNVAELAVALNRFGTRRGHSSLERIVLLATSTGSLAAIDAASPHWTATVDALGGTRPATPEEGTRPVAAPIAARTPLTPPAATPPPVSSSHAPHPPARTRRVLIGAATALAFGAVTLWLLPTPSDDAREHVAPLQPAPAAAPATSPPRPSEAREPTIAPIAPEAEPSAAPPAPASSPSPPASPPAPGARGDARGPSAAVPAASARSAPEQPGAGGASPDPVGDAVAGSAGTTVEALPSSTPAAPLPPAPSAPAIASKPPRPASPWDLGDIEFRDDERR